MKLLVGVFITCVLCSCDKGRFGKYVYIEPNSKMGCVIVHTDKDCGKSIKTLCVSGELFQTANYSKGQWTFRYRGNFDTPLFFCAKCVSESQMEIISDSIYARQGKLDSQYIQEMIDELQEMKSQAIKQENAINQF